MKLSEKTSIDCLSIEKDCPTAFTDS